MWIKLDKLRAQGVEFDWDKKTDSITFQTDGWNPETIDAFQNLEKALGLTNEDVDAASIFLSNLVILRAIKNAAQ